MLNFEKKLIVLSGGGDAKGTVALERNAYGTFATVNIYNVPDLRAGEYGLGLKTRDAVFSREMGSLGRMSGRYKIPDMPLGAVHCVLFETAGDRVVMYGTTAREKLWESNLMDGLRSVKVEKSKADEPAPAAAQEQTLPAYSGRPKEITDYFLDIVPDGKQGAAGQTPAGAQAESERKEDGFTSDGSEEPTSGLEEAFGAAQEGYADDAVAQVNYYAGGASLDGDGFAARPATGDFPQFLTVEEQPADGAVSASDKAQPAFRPRPVPPRSPDPAYAEAAATVNASTRPLPSELERRYLYRYREGRRPFSATESEEPPNPSVQTASAEAREPTPKIGFAAEQAPSAGKGRAAEQNEPAGKGAAAESKSRTKKGPDAVTVEAARVMSAGGDEVMDAPPAGKFTAQDAVSRVHTSATFYEQVSEQIDELFTANPRFELLEKLMPDTRWVRVGYDEGGKFYIVGLIGARPDYLCYGVPGTFSPEAPPELDGYCQWLPTDPEKPEDEGFWLMFQDAATGDSVQSGMQK